MFLTLAALLAAVLPAQIAPNIPAPVVHPTFPPGERAINVVSWSGNQLPKIYQRSDQLPLTDEELMKLAKEGFEADDLVKMIEERRCNCDASADGLIRLKRAGVPKQVISAVSLHGLKPNRHLNLEMTIDFSGDSREARQGTLYVFVDDGDKTRVLTASISELLAANWATERMVDRSDILLTKSIRRIVFYGSLPLKRYGAHSIMVVASAKPNITHPSQLTDAERANAQLYSFDFPRTSLNDICRVYAGYQRDPVLAYQWRYAGSRFECEWD